MTTYVYETIPQQPGEEPKYYEIKQSMKEAPLERHPETGEPIRRVMQGGYGILSGSKPQPPARPGDCACCSECCCR
jgi:predicted nucleic acid-binding Zn ribbon protein